MSSQLCRLRSLIFTLAFLSPSGAFAQIPFYTDDADTTPKGKFHLEFFNEHDWLQPSSYPGLRQNTSNFSLNYGLTDRIELGVNAPLIKIFYARESMLGNAMGIGDTQLDVKRRAAGVRSTHFRSPKLSAGIFPAIQRCCRSSCPAPAGPPLSPMPRTSPRPLG